MGETIASPPDCKILLVATYAAGCTDYQRQSFYDSLHAGLTVSEIKAICTRLDLRDVEVRRSSDRHWCLEGRALE